ncbi:MAG: DUF998 domain-containing protein [Chloroflexi bacterium]|nr:DUF998 domain-containing protein [Chloroflexota bacterium]
MFRKAYPLLGILAPLCYLAAVVIGGLITPGYSHLYNTISELMASDQPRRGVLEALFTLYNVLLLLFGLGGALYFRTNRLRLACAVFILVTLSAILGLLLAVFRQDPRGVEMTTAGLMHIVLTGLTAPATVACALLMGLALWREPNMRGWALYSLVLCAAILATGGLAALAVANDWRAGGLFERLTIGLFLACVLSMGLLARQREAASQG